MATKPIKFLELHYTMTQFLIKKHITCIVELYQGWDYLWHLDCASNRFTNFKNNNFSTGKATILEKGTILLELKNRLVKWYFWYEA